jgi:recombinase
VAAAQVLNDGRSLRAIAAALAEQGFVTPAGREYPATSVKRMLGEGGSKSRAQKHFDAEGRAFFGLNRGSAPSS